MNAWTRHGPCQEHSGNLARWLTGGHGSLPWTGVRGRKMTSSPFTKHPTRSASSIARQTGRPRLGREAVTSLTLVPMRGLRLGVLLEDTEGQLLVVVRRQRLDHGGVVRHSCRGPEAAAALLPL